MVNDNIPKRSRYLIEEFPLFTFSINSSTSSLIFLSHLDLPNRLLEKFSLFTPYLRFRKAIFTVCRLGNGLFTSICVWNCVLLLSFSLITSCTSSLLLVDAISLQHAIADVDSIIERLAIFQCSDLRFWSQFQLSQVVYYMTQNCTAAGGFSLHFVRSDVFYSVCHRRMWLGTRAEQQWHK